MEDINMTPTEIVKSSHHFRIIMNIVRKNFPYVVGYEIDDNFDEKWDQYNLNFFVNLILSAEKVSQYRPNWEKHFWVDDYLKRNGVYESIFISSIYELKDGESGPSPSEDEKSIEDLMTELYRQDDFFINVKIKKQPGISNFILTN
jgi:hypothetical protein